MRRPAAIGIALAVALALAGCGEERTTGAQPAPSRATALVDPSKDPPYVNDLAIDPARPDAYLLTTNTGFYRVRDGRAERIGATVSADGRQAPVGSFLELAAVGPGELIGSGHPDTNALPEFLGVIRSQDGGRTWTSVSRLGEADIHKFVRRHDRLYGWDAVLSALLVSEDGGRTFVERFTPRGLALDFEVSPQDPDEIVLATEEQLFRTEDGGASWRAALPAAGVRLAWPTAERLVRAGADGVVHVSADGGRRWERIGELPGPVADFEAVSADDLSAALVDGSIHRSTDGGRTWTQVFRPPPA